MAKQNDILDNDDNLEKVVFYLLDENPQLVHQYIARLTSFLVEKDVISRDEVMTVLREVFQ